MITKDGKYKSVVGCEVGYYPVANHAAVVRIGCFDSLDDYNNNTVSEIQTESVGPGTGVELFDSQPAMAAADVILHAVNPGWVDA